MSFIIVKDQAGNPPPVCPTCQLHERLFIQLVPDGGDGTPKWDEFTDDLGHRSFPPDAMQLWPASGYMLVVNEANVNPNYRSARVHIDDLEARAIEIVVERLNVVNGTPFTPPFGTNEEWRVYATRTLPRSLGLSAITYDALVAMRPGLAQFGAYWQNDVEDGHGGFRKDYRPRLMLPTGHPFEDRHGTGGRVFDIGDFEGEGPHFHFGDVWEKR